MKKENENVNEEIEVEIPQKKERSKLKMIFIIIFLLVIVSFIYIRFIATSGFIVKEYGVYNDKIPKNFDGFKIVHLSDIHYASVGKEKLDKVVDEVNLIKPDLVVFTGDLYDRFSNLTDDMRSKIIDSLSKIEATLGKYAISGNHDYEHDGYKDLIEKCGFTYLDSESKMIYYKGETPIELVGYPSYEKDEPNFDIELSSYYKIGLIHEGDAFDYIKDKGFDLVLAGHSHGGQIRLPFIGAFYTPPGAKKYYEAYYKEGNTDFYISSGLGETEFKIRAFNKPSFNLYRLYSNNK